MKERVRFTTNDRGQKIKQIMRIKVAEVKVKTPKRVFDRENCARFGEAKEGEQNVTLLSKETIPMEHPDDALIEDKDSALTSTLKAFIDKKAKRDLMNQTGIDLDSLGDNIIGGKQESTTNADGTPITKKYVPPGAIALANGIQTGVSMNGSSGLANAFGGGEKDTTIRVSNLTKSVTDGDVRELFEVFGKITRLALPKMEIIRDGETIKEPKGYAYVTFMSSSDAQVAFDTLQGHGYDHLILKLEWSKTQAPREGGGPGGSGLSGSGFTSGYGTKLAQDTKETVHGYTDQSKHNSSTGGGWGRSGGGSIGMPRG